MIPARFRELLEGGAYVTQGFDRCLMVLTEPYFKQVYDNVNTMNLADPNARLLRRLILQMLIQLRWIRSDASLFHKIFASLRV